MTNKPKTNKDWQLSTSDELKKHTLETKKYWTEVITSEDEGKVEKEEIKQIPDRWRMLNDVNLYDWQEECLKAWFKEKQGTIKVVTGAGKTILALAIIERIQNDEPNINVAIVVPTIVLMNQWKEELVEKSNLPKDAIGLLGGGHNDSFGERKKILICVLKSASDKLSQLVNDYVGKNLLFIIDECHRAGAPEMSKIFETKRKYNLGLSATPEREFYGDELGETEFDNNYNNSLLGRELGPIVYEMTLKDAFNKGILPKFELRHYALPLSSKERQKYEQLSRIIKDLRQELRDQGRDNSLSNDSALFSWCQGLAKQDSNLGHLARQFISKTGERKQLLYNSKARSAAVVNILQSEINNNPDARAVLFHESIEEVMNLYLHLTKKRIPVVAENSKLPDNIRENSIELFRKGIAKVIVSARSLIEGFNVPSADIGIIVASNTSVRQRIQTLGRVLRKGKSGDKEKNAAVYVLYMENTTDEFIYERTDWNKIIGAERNRYFYWDLENEPVERDGPPREPKTREVDISEDLLVEGAEYPGDYEGIQYSSDSEGNVYDVQNRPAVNPQGIPSQIKAIKKEYGRFKVTPNKKYVLILKHDQEGWKTIYITKLKEEFKFEEEGGSEYLDIDFQLGDKFPRDLIDESKDILLIKQKGGGNVIARKHKRGELFARLGDNANSKVKGKNASLLLEKIKLLRERGVHTSKVIMTSKGHLVYLDQGHYYYITTIPEGLEFPGG